MIPKELKSLIDKYCMGVNPTDEQMDQIIDLAAELGVDSGEMSEYTNKMIKGPTKEERDAAKAARAKAAKEKKAREAKEKAEFEAAKRKVVEDSEVQYVDLGLSVQWATHNVGASSPEGYGDFFAWGETEPKSTYDWESYEWSDEGDSERCQFYLELYKSNLKKKLASKEYLSIDESIGQEFYKYCTNSNNGDVDNLVTLEKEDDAATANLGSKWRFWEKNKWRTPTIDEWKELEEKCQWTWTDIKGKAGFLVTAKNGNSIFLPAAGYKFRRKNVAEGQGILYWSSSLNTEYPYKAMDYRKSGPDGVMMMSSINWDEGRCLGLSVRPVKDK